MEFQEFLWVTLGRHLKKLLPHQAHVLHWLTVKYIAQVKHMHLVCILARESSEPNAPRLPSNLTACVRLLDHIPKTGHVT